MAVCVGPTEIPIRQQPKLLFLCCPVSSLHVSNTSPGEQTRGETGLPACLWHEVSNEAMSLHLLVHLLPLL